MCLGTINSVSDWNHAEDMLAISPLTTNVCMTCYETFSFKCYRNNVSHTIVVSLLAMSLGDWLDWGRWVGTPKGENSMATSGLGYENLTTTIPILSANGPRKIVILPCIYY